VSDFRKKLKGVHARVRSHRNEEIRQFEIEADRKVLEALPLYDRKGDKNGNKLHNISIRVEHEIRKNNNESSM